MSKEPVSWWSNETLKVLKQLFPLGNQCDEFINDENETNQGKQLIQRRETNRPKCQKGFSQPHSAAAFVSEGDRVTDWIINHRKKSEQTQLL